MDLDSRRRSFLHAERKIAEFGWYVPVVRSLVRSRSKGLIQFMTGPDRYLCYRELNEVVLFSFLPYAAPTAHLSTIGD